MKNLRVAVIPTETGNGIDQNSSVEDILNCKEVEIYPITDYFKAQNDEELPVHWSFLIDIEKNVDLTGTNIDGVHMHTKTSQIAVIKRIIEVWGETTSTDLELDSSPCLNSINNGHVNVSELVEGFRPDGVDTITCQGENVLYYSHYSYEELSDGIIVDIHKIMLDYEKVQGDLESENE